jgi:hypothetical protein
VQARPDQLEQPLVALQLLDLERRDQPVRGERRPVLAEAGGACDPDHDLQVAQAAGLSLQFGSSE